MRGNRLVPSIAFGLLLLLGSGPFGPEIAHAASTPKPKPTPSAAARITFGLQPATKGLPDSRGSYRYAVTPGGTLRDQIAVRNLSTTTVTFRVYATDAVNVDNGGFGLLPRAQLPRDVGKWVTVGGRGFNGTVSVKANSVAVLPLSLKVPSNAQPGDHTGGIVVAVSTRSRNATGTNVELDQRVGARMFVRVSGRQRPSLTVKPIRVGYENSYNPFGRGRTVVTYRVTNTGNINLGGRQRVSVRGLIGPTQLSPRVPDAGLLLPGGHIDVTTSVRDTWPLLRERATVTIDPLVPPGDVTPGLKAYLGSASFWAVPWTLLALLVVVGAGLLSSRRLRRARPARVIGAPAVGAPEPGPGGGPTGARGTRDEELRVRTRSAGRFGASTTLVLAGVIAASGTAVAADVPYTDANATGGITLCDAQGKVTTSGRIDVPLAATVVGGGAAPAPYDGDGRAAGLAAYQPRKRVDPGLWSGQGLTALSRYTNPKHPMVEILPRDYTIRDFISAYPAQWDGLVQLRIHLRVPNQPTKNDTYSATTLKVSGRTWQQVGTSAGAVCTTGRAQSVVRLLGLPIVAPDKASGARASGARATPTISAPTPVASSSGNSSSGNSQSGPATPSIGAADALAKRGSPSSVTSAAAGDDTSPLIWVVPVAVLLVAVLLELLRFVRRRPGWRGPK